MKKSLLIKISTLALSVCSLLCIGTACKEEHTHSYIETLTAPTCTEQGFTTYTCSCGNSYVDDYVEELGHSFIDYNFNDNATCTENGTETATCSRVGCQETDTRTKENSALNHEFTNYISDNNATCTENGTETSTCSRQGCNETDTRTEENSALNHDFTDYISDNNATYTSDGTKTAICNRNGCNEKDTVTETGTKLASGISFKTLSVTGTDVYGKVSNATETFSFINEVAAVGTAKFVVSLDIYGSQQVATKTISLNVGDNKVYIIEVIDDEPKTVYEVVVRRRQMYDVTFNTDGGTSVLKQVVEEDDLATKPETTRTGYTFKAWDYDFAMPITKNTVINASWTANTDTPYKVEYYLQNLEDDNYTLEKTVNKTGTTDTTANAEIKTFTHFTHKASATDSGNINGDGSTILKVYYTRDKYTVTFYGNGGTLASGAEIQTVKYGGSVTAPVYEKTGYTFTGYDKTNYTNISESFTVMVQWRINQYTITIVYGNGQDDKKITQDYNTPIESMENPERAGYGFDGWDKTMPTTMPAANITVTAKWQTIFTLSGNIITGLTDYGKANYTVLHIPSQIDGVQITSIGNSAFSKCSGLTSITIPDSVTSIGNSAFYYCSGLRSITIGNGVTEIAKAAFYYCSGLTSIVIPDNVTVIGELAFGECYHLMEMMIPFVGATKDGTSNTHFGYIFGASSSSYNANYVPTSLKKVKVTGGKSIGYGAFYGCTGLTNITLADSVTSIGGAAFSGCTGLTNMVIPNSVTLIEGSNWYDCGAFYNCAGLKSVTIGCSVTSIGNYAFSGCSGLTSIVIPDSVTSIGESAFSKCSCLTEITIPFVGATKDGTSNTHFGYIFGASSSSSNADYVPTTLEEVMITGGTSIEYEAFRGCKYLTSVVIPDSVTAIGGYAFYYCSGLTSIVIPDSVISIGNYAFSGCSGLTSIVIPDNVTSIGDYAFYGCSGLTSITVAEGNTAYQSIDGNLYTKDGKTFIQYAAGKKATSFTIPIGVTSIENNAFYRCDKLTSIVIPDSVTSIWNNAFYDCSGLTEMTIPFVGATKDGTSNTHFGYIFGASSSSSNANYVPKSLKKVTITGGTSIEYEAFRDCKYLTSVVIPDSVTAIGGYAFYYCSGLTSIVIPDSVISIGNYAFSGCSGLTSITVAEGNTAYQSIDGNLYTKDGKTFIQYAVGKKATSFTIPIGVTSIENNAFSRCIDLRSVVIPDNVISIGGSAFSGCSGLTEITIPFVGATKDGTSNTHFGYIFGASSSSYNVNYVPTTLKKVTITGGTSIEYEAFRGCKYLTSVVIPDSVTAIEGYAFYYCSGLISIVIPDSVTSIGHGAFSVCDKLIYNTYDNAKYLGNEKNPYHALITSTTDTISSCLVQEDAKIIADSAFYECSILTSIVIPNSVTSIGKSAFSGCSWLTSIIIPDNVTSIEDSAFYGCHSLTSIVISDSITSIGDSAFYNCNELTSIVIPDNVTSIGENAFVDCYKLVEVVNKSSHITVTKGGLDNGCVGYYALAVYNSGDTFTGTKISNDNGYIVYTDGTEKILLKYTGGETDLILPTYITKIHQSAFSDSASLTSVVIGDSVTSIGKTAFYNCSSLTSVTIGSSVTSIEEDAFYRCSGLANIVIPDNVTSIGKGAFSACTSLTSVVIGDGVTLIEGSNRYDEGAFSGCDKLISVVIGNSVTSIGEYAFYSYYSSLSKVYYKGTAEEWSNISISSDNDNLTSAWRYYYSETKPTTSGLYWHYDVYGYIAIW